jgi:F-type H+-transporting ATPase subunit alpha
MAALQYKQFGVVQKIRGCIVEVTGLENCINGQLIQFGFGTEGIVMGFTGNQSGVLLIKEKTPTKTGDVATMTLKPYNAPVGESFVGRVINVIGEPLDNLGPIKPEAYAPIFPRVPSVLDRKEVNVTVETGINTLDAVIPIGRGQRQLILGDKMSGKTCIGTDIVLNQKGKDMICIYCLIGKSTTALDRLVALFKSQGAFKYTIVICALAGQNPGQQYLAPYVASTMGEYFMNKGGHVVVCFDDFTKHAWAYREVSLLMGRPPGRESYPGDVFYLHSRMIERAAQLSDHHGGGSMTFFPMVELLEGDVTGYIATNLISMTDGQILLSIPLFNEGFKPAIDIGLSVSRIGSKVQWKAMKKVAGKLRLKYLQYRKKLQLAKLQSGEQTAEFKDQMREGEILTQLFIQDKDKPRPMVEQIFLFYGLNKRYLHQLDDDDLKEIKVSILQYAEENFPDLVKMLNEKKDLTESVEKGIDELYTSYLAKLKEKKKKG